MPQEVYNTGEVDDIASNITARVTVNEADIADLAARIVELENAVPEPPPQETHLFDANFQAGGNVTKEGDIILVNGKPALQVYYNNYGAGTDGNKIQSWNNPANVELLNDGLRLSGLIEAGTGTLAKYPASAAFLGTRDVPGATNDVKYPLPLYGTFTVEFTPDGYVEDFDSVWLRHEKGSGVGEIDFFETVSAELSGEKGLQFGIPQLGLGQGAAVLYKARYAVPVRTRVKLVMTCYPVPNTNDAVITVTLNGQAPVTTITGRTDVPPKLEYRYDRTKLEAQTTDPNHAWDIAIQKHEGFLYGADVMKTYTGTLRNGSKGVAPGGETKSWTVEDKISQLVIHRITVDA